MNTDQPGTTTSQTNNERGHEQFPGDTRVITKVRFITNDPGGDLLRILVMNDLTTAQLSAHNEYNYGGQGVSVESLASFTMTTERLEGTQQAIDGFVGSMALHVATPQSATWLRSVYVPTGARKRLFKAVDPDDSTRMIGVLLEQDAQGQLSNITWYKTKDAGVIFHNTPSTLAFEQVKDERGEASLDPNDIGGWTWYYATTAGQRA